MADRPDWMNDKSRATWARNSARHRRDTLRSSAARCRRAFRKEHMGVVANWLADAYDEAAAVFQRRLDEIGK